ncbi:polyamine-transporting ATPase 13A3 isoform X2 [Helicoverpa armigera]|uniref:polyamine-transporting ATPase 13A3-like isoform X2 n=1 Tax=Helicoverpa zea TaxID=7113 RepID=UPI000B367106|nr:polyamine-transporting ATPase 13A3-like isoform X2 [Helicoverpa zea]XP_049702893.1 polyamine-transporting ATPase 13A3 isoform X2 [Helicoverpa armigera]
MPNINNACAANVIGETQWQVIESSGDEQTINIHGFTYSKLRAALLHTVCILLCGLPYFALAYYPSYNRFKYIKCSLKTAKEICVIDADGGWTTEKVLEIDLNLSNHKDNRLRYFMYKHNRFIWLNDQGIFINVLALNEKLTIQLLMENMSGINKRQQNELIKLYGTNSVEVEVKSYWTLFVEEVFNPFYLFQVFSIILWSLDEYYQYATCVFLLSVATCMLALYQTKKMSINLHKMAGSTSAFTVTVLRPTRSGREECVVNACRLVPGDVLVLPPDGCVMPCDTMLLTGTCIVDESMLTGESVPVMKGPPCSSAEIYSTEGHKRHTLFAGTHVLQTRFYGNNQVLAKVVRTGFYTAKGELLKSILFPKPFGFQFYKDAVKFVIFMFCIAAIGMGYSIWLYVVRGSLVGTIVLRTLDIITIVVPPALPAAMTAGIVYSQNRLRKNRIFCVSPPRIVICGKLQVMCFDKTGTLTEDGLDFYSVIPARSGEKFGECVVDVGGLPVTSPLIQALASCHSLTSIQGQLKGDPLDLKMFEFTQWILEEPGPENTRYDNLTPAIVKPVTGNNEALQNLEDYDPFTMEIPYEIGLLRRFHFSSAQQSMGVIARVLGQPQMVYFVKGAPEKVAGMCNPDTLPENFSSILNEYTSNGFRVIGLAHKKLDRKMKWVDAQRVKRTSLECDMAFLGFLVMQNSLKPETTQVIRELHDASMRLIMVTGDNIMTAMSVARGCCMVQPHEKLLLITAGQPQTNDTRPPLIMEVVGDGGPPKLPLDAYVLALEGKTWAVIRTHYPELMPVVLTKGMVFGRFGPDQKTQLVTALQGEDLVVGMCGDGANDCGALKAAHVGISLSEADASVAAPFTSQEQNIKCVKLLALEGRCALSTSFAIFKYMALYSLIQFFSILILYNFYSILGNNQFLYIDLVLTTLLALSLGRASPGPLLTRQSPPVSLVALSSILPLVIQVSLVLLMQIASIYLLYAQPWFKPVEGGPDVEQVLCWENTVLFIITAFQYLIMACVYAKGWPFRQPFCTNYYMMITLVTQSIFVTVLLLCPWHWLAEFMEVEPMASADSEQTMFRIYLLLIPALHLILAIAVEATLSDSDKFSRLGRAMRRRCDKQAAGDAASPLWPEPHDHVQLC